jgi:hypothetical protein
MLRLLAHIPAKPGPDVIRPGYRFADKNMRQS